VKGKNEPDGRNFLVDRTDRRHIGVDPLTLNSPTALRIPWPCENSEVKQVLLYNLLHAGWTFHPEREIANHVSLLLQGIRIDAKLCSTPPTSTMLAKTAPSLRQLPRISREVLVPLGTQRNETAGYECNDRRQSNL
jgi:hypothetical protein